MSVTTASFLARRAAQKQRVRILYRRSLRDTLNWAVHRRLFYQDADELRMKFDAQKNVSHGLRVVPSFAEIQSHLKGLRSSTTMDKKRLS